jgi:hypothetical protein
VAASSSVSNSTQSATKLIRRRDSRTDFRACEYAPFASKSKRRAPIAHAEPQKCIAPEAVAALVRLLHMVETGLARRFGAAATREDRPIGFDG